MPIKPKSKKRPWIVARDEKQWSKVRHKDNQSFYSDPRWRRLRLWHLNRNPVCVKCGSTSNLHVDHKIPIEEGGEKYNQDNLQTLCKSSHSKKTIKEQNKRRWK